MSLTHARCLNILQACHKSSFFFAFQRSGDAPVLLTKNEIKTVKKLVFKVVRNPLKIDRINKAEFEAYNADLHAVLVWALREQRLILLIQKS